MSVKSSSLTTAQRVCDYMGITLPTGTKLTAMEKMIDAVSSLVLGYIDRTLKKTTYTREMYDTERSPTLGLDNFPIIAGETFTLERRTSAQNEDDWETVDTLYYHVENATGIIYCANYLLFSKTRMGYRVTYTAGYDFNNTTTFLSDTDVGDIELVVWMLVEGSWNKRGGGAGIERESIGDYSVTYKKSLFESEDIKSILDKYCVPTGMGVITPFLD